MTTDPQTPEPDKVRIVTLGFYPLHDAIVRQFADDTHRTYSNAARFIIEDWARLKRLAPVAAEPSA